MFFSTTLLTGIGFISTGIVLFCLGNSYILLLELSCDIVSPMEICEKINHFKSVEYITHLLLFVVLFLRGWWVVGILNFPFLFYNFAKWHPGKHFIDSTKVFSILTEVMSELKVKSGFFSIVVLYHLWEWVTWVPPVYIPVGKSFNRMRNFQFAH